MTRDDAFNLLGLYLGASEDHIRAKHASKREAVERRLLNAPETEHAALRAELARLDEAAAIASGKAPESSAPTDSRGLPATQIQTAVGSGPLGGPVQTGTQPIPAAPGRRSKGWIVVAALLLGLAGYYVATKAGMWFFDKEHKEEATPEVIADAETASAAWLTYLSRSGQPETEEGRKASEALNKGAGARAAGDMNLAQREYNTAWQAYFNAFKAEATRAEQAWKSEVVDPWRQHVQPYFPFDPLSTKDASIPEMSKILNPKDGKAWSHSRWFDALAVADIKGTKFFTPPKGRAEFLQAGQKVRDAMFEEDRDRLWVPFTARVLHGRMWGRITFEIGNKVADSHADGLFDTFSWRNEGGGCAIKAWALGGRRETGVIDRSNSAWGLLRILRECKYEGVIENAQTWSLTALEQREGSKRESPTLQIMTDRSPSPFDLGIYAACKLE